MPPSNLRCVWLVTEVASLGNLRDELVLFYDLVARVQFPRAQKLADCHYFLVFFYKEVYSASWEVDH